MSFESFDWAEEVEEELGLGVSGYDTNSTELNPKPETKSGIKQNLEINEVKQKQKDNTLAGSMWSTLQTNSSNISIKKKSNKQKSKPKQSSKENNKKELKQDLKANESEKIQDNNETQSKSNGNNMEISLKVKKKEETQEIGLEASRWAKPGNSLDDLAIRLDKINIKEEEEETKTLEWKDLPKNLDVIEITNMFKAFKGNKGIKLRYVNDRILRLNFETIELASKALEYFKNKKLGGEMNYQNVQVENIVESELKSDNSFNYTRVKPQVDSGPAKRMIAHSLGVRLPAGKK